MGLRKEVPHARCSPLCAIKEKLQELWDRAYGCINKINDITPDGDGKFSIQAGTNIQLTEISNGLKIDTTGGITYYSAADTYIDVNNNDLEISLVNPGQTGGVALHDDLDVVAQAVVDVVNGTTQVGDAAHADAADSATYLGSATSNVGSDTKPVKIVNGEAVAVTNDLMVDDRAVTAVTINGMTVYIERKGSILNICMQNGMPTTTGDFLITEATTSGLGLVPILGGDGYIKGYLYGNGSEVWLRTLVADSSGQGFRAIYFTSV